MMDKNVLRSSRSTTVQQSSALAGANLAGHDRDGFAPLSAKLPA
jgi:hypothetical protein